MVISKSPLNDLLPHISVARKHICPHGLLAINNSVLYTDSQTNDSFKLTKHKIINKLNETSSQVLR